jgi:hypothetical protein
MPYFHPRETGGRLEILLPSRLDLALVLSVISLFVSPTDEILGLPLRHSSDTLLTSLQQSHWV